MSSSTLGFGDAIGAITIGKGLIATDLLGNPLTKYTGTQDVIISSTPTTSLSYSAITDKPQLFSGDFNDLVNRPVLLQGVAGQSIIGLPGRDGKDGRDGSAGKDGQSIVGQRGLPGRDGIDGQSIVGQTGARGQHSTVPGPQGPAGAASTIAGPQGPAGAPSTVAGPAGPAGAASTIAGPQGPAYGFATNGAVDLCLNLLPINTLDSETALAPHIFITSAVINAGTGVTLMTIPCINRTGVFASGVTPSAVGDSLRIGAVSGTVISFGVDTIVIQFASQNTPSIPSGTLFQVTSANPVKVLSDRTLSLIPYSRGSGERSLRLYNESPWVRVGSTQFGVLTVKLFDDQGFALKIRKIYASTNAVDLLDCNICDWTMQLDVALAPQKVLGLI